MSGRISADDVTSFHHGVLDAKSDVYRLTGVLAADHDNIKTAEVHELRAQLVGILGQYVRSGLPCRLSPDAIQMLEDINACLARDAAA